jgi:hypothetical protein
MPCIDALTRDRSKASLEAPTLRGAIYRSDDQRGAAK